MNKVRTELKWGIILPVAMLLLMCAQYFTGLQSAEHINTGGIVDFIFGVIIIPVIVYYLGIREKRDTDNNGRISWGEGVISGFTIALIAVPFSVIGLYFFLEVVNPHYFQTMIDLSLNIGYPLEVVEKQYNLENYLMMTAGSTLFGGVVISMLIALILRKI